uniref:Uncharacterized protein n=1 Tax=Aegilops tauschii subsp. strangulata TaxID=200361 RepID=A0A453LGG9_AEGTS
MGRSPCCEKAHTNKGAWTKEEDDRLTAYIKAHGEGCWRSLPKAAGLLRCGKSCRLRWINYLRPDLKRGNFSDEEDELIIKLHSLLGNKWSLIAGRLPGRTDNEIKNYWNTHIRRKLTSRGIDPVTHRAINSDHAASNITISFEAAQRDDKGAVFRRDAEPTKPPPDGLGPGEAAQVPGPEPGPVHQPPVPRGPHGGHQARREEGGRRRRRRRGPLLQLQHGAPQEHGVQVQQLHGAPDRHARLQKHRDEM